MIKKLFVLGAAILAVTGSVRADWIEDTLREEAEELLTPVVRDIGLGISAGMTTKAGSLSFPGAEVSAKAGIISVSEDNELIDSSYLPVPIFSAEVGLPIDIDVFLRGMSIPLGGETIGIIGGGVRYSLFDDTLLSPFPALSVTAGMNRFSAGDISVTATTIGVSASKKVLFLTPYAGISYEMFSGEFDSEVTEENLEPEDSLIRVNLGAELNPFPAVFLGAGVDINGEGESGMGFYTALGARVSFL